MKMIKRPLGSVCWLGGTVLVLGGAALPLQAQLTTDTFGSGGNTFTMDFVTIGNPGNLADTSPAARGIFIDARGVNRPATGVSWNEAARFVNWLNVSKGYSPAYKFSLQPGDGG